jgi:hypothetical protein
LTISNDWHHACCRWEPRLRHTSEEKNETLNILRWLTAAPTKRLGALSTYRIAKDWPGDSIYGIEIGISREQVKRWLDGRNCPGDENLWYFAEAFRSGSRPWCNGLALLWACGRIARCVQIVAFLLFHEGFDDDHIEQVWQLLCHLDRLFREVFIDEISANAKLEYLTTKMPSLEGIRIAVRVVYDSPSAPNLASLSLVYDYITREADKLFLSAYDAIAPSMEAAARRAFRNEELIVPSSRIAAIEALDLAFKIGNATNLASDTKRDIALEYLARAFNALEHEPPPTAIRPTRDAIASNLFPQLRELPQLDRLEAEAFAQDPEWREQFD